MGHNSGIGMPQTFPPILVFLDDTEKTTDVTSWLAVLPNHRNKLSHDLRVQHNSKMLQTKRDQPRSSNTNMAKTRMAKRTTGLMLRVVLVEELTQAQNIQCPPMDIELITGAKPFFARKPRKTPLHWGEKVKKEIKKLLKSGVIERIPANEATQWI